MNKIFKVIYSKTRHCYVVVSELAKSHCKTTQSHTVRSKTALTAAVLLALGAFSFVGMPVVQAADGTESLRNNDFVGANDYYWYYDEKEKDKDKKWKTYQYKATDIFNNRSRHDLPNYQGGGAKLPGAITAGLYAQAGQQTVTIGDRNAGQSKGSVFIGEHSGYNNGDNAPAGMKNNYVTSVGFQSDATGWGSIAIGSNATAENSKMESQVVEEVGDAHTSGTVRDDTYGIKENPKIQGASVALGYNAHSNDGNIAIGSYSDATSTDKNDSYVSVGNANLKRRITNVADGASASDVATVGQLQALSDKVGVYDAGFGIKIASDKDNKTNTISLNRNLGTNYTDKAHHGDEKVTVAVDDTGLVLGGYAEDEKGNKKNPAVTYGATGDDSVTVGGMNSLASGRGSVVTGGVENIASGATAVAIGGNNNDAIGTRSAVLGGLDNTAFGNNSMVSGGSYNVAGGIQSAVLGGFSNYALGTGTTSIGGYGKDYGTGYDSSVNGDYSVGVAGGSTGKDAKHALAAGNQAVVTTENGTAIGYQATTDEANTIAFGHDADDVSGYTIEWNKLPEGQVNADGTTNDYTKAPKSVTPTTYKDAYYNRLVKVADGQDDHDVVVMEQLKQYAKKDASNIGNNLTVTPVYQTDDQGNIKLGSDNKPLIDKEKTEQKRKDDQTTNKNDWGQALGADPFTAGTATTATDASTSDQLVTGKTLYNYDAPVAASDKKLNYVSANNTTGQNLSALDAQVKANADELNKPNRNIKYYSVKDSSLTVDGYTNENNDGAKGRGSLAAGFVTHADGIASTVVGSYSGVMNTGTALGPLGRDYRGATAVSLGTVNVNNNTDTSKPYSGVANSIVGQANMTTNSNAAIIYGAGNTVTDSYRPIDSTKAWAILGSVSDPKELSKAMQAAVKDSGGQVMVMGGGNTVDKAYMTQVTGVGNTVTGTDSTYAEGTSTQYNFVDGFQNELTNGKHDYIIGSNNKVSGESIDKNQSNIVFGDNHKLTNQKNNVIIGSSDTADDETTASDVVAIGHNAKVTKEGGVAIGSGSEATTAAGVAGYDPTGATADTTAAWTSKKAAVSVGTADETRQITGVAAGKEETDAVNVAQLKKLNGMKANVNADNIGKNLKGSDGITPATEEEQKANLNQWGEAIGTGSIASDSSQLVTGKTVYSEVRPTADGKYVKTTKTTGENLAALDTQVGTNTGDIKDLKDLKNITEAGQTVIKNLSKDAVQVKAGDRVKVDETVDDATGNKTYTISAKNDGKVEKGNTNLVSGDTVNTAIKNAIQDSTTDTDSKLALKANVDASNIGKNLKESDGITPAMEEEQKANLNQWGEAIGTGSIASDSSQLVTGKTVYSEVRPTADGKYVKTTKTTGENLAALDTQVGTNTGDIKDLKDLKNITEAGQTVIKNLSKDAVQVKAGDRVKVDETVDDATGNKTYTISAKNDGKVEKGNTNLVSGDTVNTAIKNAIQDSTTDTDSKLALKANVDASNIGKNLKESDGITPAMEEEQKANLNQWGEAIGTGSIASDNGQLVTGKTVYEYNKPVVAEGKTLNYVSDTNTTGQNLGSLDAQVGTNTGDISNLKNLSNISSAGETVIKNLAKGSIGMENGSHTTVSHRDANGVETYKVDVNVDGKVESGNKGIVDGGAVYSAIQDVKNQTSADLANKANVDASNLTPNNVTKWQEKLGNGKVESGNTGLVTGDTVFKAVDTKANRDGSNLTDKEADSFSEKIARGEVKAGENRAVSGDAVSQAISKVTGDMNTKLDGKANTSLDNITKDGQTVIKKLSQDAVQVKAGDDHITVDAKTDETTGNKTYTISAKDGKVASGDTGLISGGTLYNEVHVDKDGSYIKSGNTVGNNLSALDTGLKNTSSLIHTNTSGDTIHIGETSKATKVDVSSTDANGNKNGRVVTGVVTDAKDANSAANVGYVNGVTAANTQQIYRDMNNAYSRLDTNINRAAAGSNALAALHPLDFDPADKASFAIGYGHYRNANAAAVGAFYQPNANTMVNMGISLGNGDPGFNAGVSFKIGKGSAYNGVSKAEMAQTIHDQATEISAIKADDAAKDKRIDALEKENQEMKKQIQEILARLNG